jgi:hypothetical protein
MYNNRFEWKHNLIKINQIHKWFFPIYFFFLNELLVLLHQTSLTCHEIWHVLNFDSSITPNTSVVMLIFNYDKWNNPYFQSPIKIVKDFLSHQQHWIFIQSQYVSLQFQALDKTRKIYVEIASKPKGFSIFINHTYNLWNSCNSFFKVDIITSLGDIICLKNE